MLAELHTWSMKDRAHSSLLNYKALPLSLKRQRDVSICLNTLQNDRGLGVFPPISVGIFRGCKTKCVCKLCKLGL